MFNAYPIVDRKRPAFNRAHLKKLEMKGAPPSDRPAAHPRSASKVLLTMPGSGSQKRTGGWGISAQNARERRGFPGHFIFKHLQRGLVVDIVPARDADDGKADLEGTAHRELIDRSGAPGHV